MNYKLVGAALVALAVVATGAAAAMPGNAPVDAPMDNNPDQTGNESVATGPGAAADADSDGRPAAAANPADRRGPPVDLPDQVPDFVGEVHDLIRQHLDGSLDGGLGDRVSDLTPEGDQPATETPA